MIMPLGTTWGASPTFNANTFSLFTITHNNDLELSKEDTISTKTKGLHKR